MRVLVVGSGATAYYLVRQFLANGWKVTVVDGDPADAAALAERTTATVVVGDGTDPVLLERAGARRMDVVLALTGADHDNLAVCQVAQRKFGVPRALSLVNDPDHAGVFRRLGVTLAVSPTQLLVQVLQNWAGFEEIRNFIPVADGRIAISEVALREGAPAVGRLLKDVPLPEGALVGCVIRDGEAIVPRGGTHLQAGDRLVVVARPEQHRVVLEVLAGETA